MVEFEFKTLEGGVLATLVGGDGSHRLNLSVDGAKVEGKSISFFTVIEN